MYTKTKKHTNDKINLQNDLENIKKNLFNTRDAIVDAAYDVKGKAKSSLNKQVKKVKIKSLHAKNAAKNYVKAKPLQAIGIAMAAGLLIDRLFLRK